VSSGGDSSGGPHGESLGVAASVARHAPASEPAPNFRLKLLIPLVSTVTAGLAFLVIWVLAARDTNAGSPPATIPAGFVWMAGGKVTVGSSPEERAEALRYAPPGAEAQIQPRIAAELPLTGVKLAGFLAGIHPVSNREYLAFVEATGHRTPALTESEWAADASFAAAIGDREDGAYQRYAAPQCWQDGKPQAARLDAPVTLVSLADAQAYCAWLAAKLGTPVRLPDEIESEALAGASPYPWGSDWRLGAANAGPWIDLPAPAGKLSAGGKVNELMPAPVRQETYADRTADGVCDYAGQVYEWTATPDPVHRGFAVIKGGGCWLDMAYDCRRACRRVAGDRVRSPFVGFRVVAGR
jgi:formylglycine-generating enzyme required for sulfatase activity